MLRPPSEGGRNVSQVGHVAQRADCASDQPGALAAGEWSARPWVELNWLWFQGLFWLCLTCHTWLA